MSGSQRPGRGGAEQRLREALARNRAATGQSERDRSRTPPPSRPPRGRGATQRAAATSFAARVAADELSLKRAKTGDAFEKFCGKLMLSQKLSAVETQQLAQSGKEAGASGVDRLARAGKSGELPGNTHRDAMRALLKNCQVPEPYYADVHLAMTYEHKFLLRTPEVILLRTYVLLCPPPSTIFTSIASYVQV